MAFNFNIEEKIIFDELVTFTKNDKTIEVPVKLTNLDMEKVSARIHQLQLLQLKGTKASIDLQKKSQIFYDFKDLFYGRHTEGADALMDEVGYSVLAEGIMQMCTVIGKIMSIENKEKIKKIKNNAKKSTPKHPGKK